MTDDLAVKEAITAMVDAVNRVDMGSARGWFADSAVIVEDIPPFCWQGPDAVSNWLAAMAASAARLQVGAITMTLGDPVRIEIEHPRAYALFPGTLLMRSAGGNFLAEGLLTFTLTANDRRWLIDTLIWSGPNPQHQ